MQAAIETHGKQTVNDAIKDIAMGEISIKDQIDENFDPNKPVVESSEIRVMAKEAMVDGMDTEASIKLRKLADEIDNVDSLDNLMDKSLIPTIDKWKQSLSSQNEIIEKVHKKFNKNRKYTFLMMDTFSNIKEDLNSDFDLFKSVVYAYMNKKSCEELSQFQPKIMFKIRTRDASLIERAKEVVNFYRG
jgi:ATP-dependent Lon protease